MTTHSRNINFPSISISLNQIGTWVCLTNPNDRATSNVDLSSKTIVFTVALTTCSTFLKTNFKQSRIDRSKHETWIALFSNQLDHQTKVDSANPSRLLQTITNGNHHLFLIVNNLKSCLKSSSSLTFFYHMQEMGATNGWLVYCQYECIQEGSV